jgi:imidazole glycerol-phosphate synthase subunit HisF
VIRPRIIPCLLIADGRLVKTVEFRGPVYVGDPGNTVSIFSALGADEIFLLDIGAARQARAPDMPMLRKIAAQSIVPLGYGGGVRTLDHVRQVLEAGFEKVILSTIAGEDPGVIERAAALVGSQAVTVSIDFRRDHAGARRVYLRGGSEASQFEPIGYAREVERHGAGEILLYSIERDGMMDGYDLEVTRAVAEAVRIPVIACGGAGRREHLQEAVTLGGATAAAAGSIFVFQGRNRSVLVNYLTATQRKELFARGIA